MASIPTFEDALQDILIQVVEAHGDCQEAWDLEQIASCLSEFLDIANKKDEEELTSSQPITTLSVRKVVNEFYKIESGAQKRACRMALEDAARKLLQSSSCSGLASTMLVVVALSLKKDKQTQNRAIASAICSVLTHRNDKTTTSIAYPLFRAIFASTSQFSIDWQIVANLAKAMQFTCVGDDTMTSSVAAVLTRELDLESSSSSSSSSSQDEIDLQDPILKNKVTSSLALAAQMQPWQALQPETLVNLALRYDLWHAAERICESTVDGGAVPNLAVDTLLEGAFQAKQYKQADTFATKFYDQGGKQRYLEARYMHASGTISKVIRKGALPIVDKQVERVEAAAKKMESETVTSEFYITPTNAVDEIRRFAILQMEETGNVDSAHRLANLWGMGYLFDQEAVLAAEKARKEKYLQWEDLLPGSPPDLISTPEDLLQAMVDFTAGDNHVFGFDAEWSEDNKGADILQIASLTSVLLLDLRQLSKTEEGIDALHRTVGRLYASPTSIKVGFACRQDISKLQTMGFRPGKKCWLDEVKEVVDLQTMLLTINPELKRLGLSRVCEHYLGKPLDKSEQCSLWNARPLSVRQRTYAALDAWTVVAIYDMLRSGVKKAASDPPVKKIRATDEPT